MARTQLAQRVCGACVVLLALALAQGGSRAAEQTPGAAAPGLAKPSLPKVQTLELKGTIRPAAGVDAPEGNCSLITITAWRTRGDFTSNEPLMPQEQTRARGSNLTRCTYSLHVPTGKMVEFRASIRLQGWRIASVHSGRASFGPMIWEEKHPIVEDWQLKRLFPAPPTGPQKAPAQ